MDAFRRISQGGKVLSPLWHYFWRYVWPYQTNSQAARVAQQSCWMILVPLWWFRLDCPTS